MNKTARSIEELFPIIKSSKAGNLKAVKEWIDAGGPLNLPPGKKTRRRSPLQIAIERGFLTLTEMLLDGGADPKADNALWMSVNYSSLSLRDALVKISANHGLDLSADALDRILKIVAAPR